MNDKLKILIVDDESCIAESLGEILILKDTTLIQLIRGGPTPVVHRASDLYRVSKHGYNLTTVACDNTTDNRRSF